MSDNELIRFERGLIKRVGNVINITNKLLSLAGNSYKEIAIGKQIWMVENLNVNNFRNGDHILEAKTNEEWYIAFSNEQPAWCYYENDPLNGLKYGRLYNRYAVNDPREIAQQGWHLPIDNEWNILNNCLGGMKVSGGKMKSKNGWNNNGNGTNLSGFTGLPGGYRTGVGIFKNIGKSTSWWSYSSDTPDFDRGRCLEYKDDYIYGVPPGIANGFSIRCIKD